MSLSKVSAAQEDSLVSGVCEIHPLNEDTRRLVRPDIVMTLCAYFGVIAVAAGVILWACLGLPTNLKLLGLLVALPVLIRHFGMEYIGRRIATLTGAPAPRTSMLSHVITIIGAAFFIIVPWL